MPKSLAKVKTIVFDLDQTLVDWIGGKKACINASASAMANAGLQLPVENIKKRINEIYSKKGYEYQKVFDDLLRGLKIDPENQIYHKIKAAGIASYREAKRKYLRVYGDIPFALQDLIRMGYTLGLISDAPPFQGWLRLFELGLSVYFRDDHVYIGRGTKASKKPFEMIMKEHGYAPCELLMVGDNPQADIRPANELDIVTAITKYGQVFPIDQNDSFQFPDYYLISLWELVDLLRKTKIRKKSL